MHRSNFGIITDEVSSNLSEALDWAVENGLGHIEIRTVGGVNAIELSDAQLAGIRAEVERRGLFVSCFSSPVFKCSLDASRNVRLGDTFGVAEATVEEHFDMLLRSMEIATTLGTSHIRIFSFWREENPEQYEEDVIRHLKNAASIAAERDVLLLLENEPSCNGGYASEVGRIVRQVGSSALKVLWDPGNEAYAGKSAFPEGYEAVRDVVHHVHLKDARVLPDGTSECVPIGKGNVSFLNHFKSLLEDGYGGLFTIETHYIPHGGTARDGSNISLGGLRTLLQDAGMELEQLFRR